MPDNNIQEILSNFRGFNAMYLVHTCATYEIPSLIKDFKEAKEQMEILQKRYPDNPDITKIIAACSQIIKNTQNIENIIKDSMGDILEVLPNTPTPSISTCI